MAWRRMISNRKGFNDMFIIFVILGILIGTATIIPYLNAAQITQTAELDTDGVVSDIQQGSENVNAISAFTILLSVLKLSLFDFGDTLGLPWWLDLFYTLLATLLIITVARNIWIGGGA